MKEKEKKRLRRITKRISEDERENNKITELHDKYAPLTSYNTFRRYLNVFGGEDDVEGVRG